LYYVYSPRCSRAADRRGGLNMQKTSVCPPGTLTGTGARRAGVGHARGKRRRKPCCNPAAGFLREVIEDREAASRQRGRITSYVYCTGAREARRPLRCVTLTRMALNNAASTLDQAQTLLGAQSVEIKRLVVKVEPAMAAPSKVRVLLWVATSSDAVALRTAPWATALSAQLPVTRGYLSAEISSDADYALAVSPTTSTGILASLEPLFQPEVHANPSYVTPDDPTAFTVSESARCLGKR